MERKRNVDDGSWTNQNISGHNEKLLAIAEKMTEMAKIAIREKISKLKIYVEAESRRIPEADFSKLHDKINNLEKTFKE